MTTEESTGAIVISKQAYNLNALGAVRGLGKEGVKVTWMAPDRSRWFHSKYCDPIVCPEFTSEPRLFIDSLIRLGRKRRQKDVIIPTNDACLIVISKNKNLLERYFIPIVCNWEITDKFIDKSKIYKIAESIGVPCPKTLHPENENEVRRIASETEYPCLVKPVFSHLFASKFKRKLFRVNEPAELVKTYQYLASHGFDMMIQEDIMGEDRDLITFNAVFNERSEPLQIFMHRRLRQNPPNYGVVSLGESIWEPRIIDPSIKLLKAIGFQGIAQIEFKQDPRTGKFKFFEINGRSYLAISLPTACGVNLIHTAYRNAIGEKIPPLTSYSCTYECGVKWLDFPSYIASIVKLRTMENVSPRQWMRPILTRKITLGTFSPKDPAPFLMELDFLIKNLRGIPSYLKILRK